jgi:hypothetical protein
MHSFVCGETMVIDDGTFMTGSIFNMCTECIAIWSCFAHTLILLHSLVRWLQCYKQAPSVFTWLDGALIMVHEDESAGNAFECKSYWASCSCTRSFVVIWQSLMTVRSYEWEHIEYAQMYCYLSCLAHTFMPLHSLCTRWLRNYTHQQPDLLWRRFGWGTRENCGRPLMFFHVKLFDGCDPHSNNGGSRSSFKGRMPMLELL